MICTVKSETLPQIYGAKKPVKLPAFLAENGVMQRAYLVNSPLALIRTSSLSMGGANLLPKAKSEILVVMPMTVQQVIVAKLQKGGGHGGGGNGGLNPVVPKKKKLRFRYKHINKSR